MTLIEISYELRTALTPTQFRSLAGFANTYGLRRFRVDEKNNILSFEYDASRLHEAQVEHVLRLAGVPITGIAPATATVSKMRPLEG